MATCKYCDRSGFFLSVDTNGLCNECKQRILLPLIRNVQILKESIELAQNGKTFSTRLSRCDLAIEKARELLPVEKKGIPTVEPNPSILLEELLQMREAIIEEEVRSVIDKASKKSEVSASQRTKETALTSALIKVEEILENMGSKNKANSIRNELNYLIHKTKLDGFLEAARKAEFKNQRKKAIDHYQEALYLIKNDKVSDDEQAEIIDEIEQKVAELEGLDS
jgi:hypothetical protein